MAEFQPQEGVRVHFDPDGHPFCLYLGAWRPRELAWVGPASGT
jgi:hypothetical protein